ncbi:L,D-transpeptidase [Sulfurirhabdus autotrophica]|uniref:L,D-transpeptidase-like protein n=1 Tax=Sulfurirhabdus autotrophica TaxID=1706046 RepID=A0A4R3Y8R4_9PROT|nr:L,D-transpeptidase [Sulfurirhabdus autotrophica]TCV86703.1 L,D-transpeptidase-like protein [Sulfurirhabdus autotrophica]
MQQIKISIASQSLELLDEQGVLIKRYPVSTAKNGVGEMKGSYQTPRGKHYIRAKIGADQPVNAVFVGRRPTGEVFNAELGAAFPDRDWILTRILWLCGCEPGFNRNGNVDTMRRYIYIHGSPDQAKIGAPGSHGCIRLQNEDMVDLFNRVEAGTPVEIVET